MRFKVEFEQEEDGRWIAEVPDLPGVLAYGADRAEAQAKVQALALRVVAERLEHGEAGPETPGHLFPGCVSNWPSSRTPQVLAALRKAR